MVAAWIGNGDVMSRLLRIAIRCSGRPSSAKVWVMTALCSAEAEQLVVLRSRLEVAAGGGEHEVGR